MDLPAAAFERAGTDGTAPGLADLPARGFERRGGKAPTPAPGRSLSSTVAPAATVPATAPARATPAATSPETKEVTIRISDAPAGLTATVDGRPRDLPLRLRDQSPPVKVTFRAPGYAPREILIDPRRNPTVAIGLRPERTQTSEEPGRGKRPRPALSPPSPSDPNTSEPFPSPAPILDI
jgi:hypothetical protein